MASHTFKSNLAELLLRAATVHDGRPVFFKESGRSFAQFDKVRLSMIDGAPAATFMVGDEELLTIGGVPGCDTSTFPDLRGALQFNIE